MNENQQMEGVELAEKIEQFKDEFHRRQMGNDFTMLGPWVKELALISALNNLPEGTKPFAHMVYVVNKGTRNKELKLIGDGLGTVYDNLIAGVLKTRVDQ